MINIFGYISLIVSLLIFISADFAYQDAKRLRATTEKEFQLLLKRWLKSLFFMLLGIYLINQGGVE